MASALPVAAVGVGDISHMVAERNRRFVVAAGDTAGLGGAIEALLADRELARSIGGDNLARVRAVYTLQAMISVYDAIFAGAAPG
jgi:glycosyltransferase involved in cell wall biosynthesis